MDIKIGVIGYGRWSKNIVREMNKFNVIKMVCDINTEELDECNKLYPDITTTTNKYDILNNKYITGVCVVVPSELHYHITKEALENNKDVFVEKPLALSFKKGRELVKLAKEKNKILMIGHLMMYHSSIKKIKDIIDKGCIGKIKSITSNRLNFGIIRKTENVLWSFAPHDISMILFFCGSPLAVRCNGNKISGKYGVVHLNMVYKNLNAMINVNWMCPYKEQKLTIIGEKGIILFDDVNKIVKYQNFLKDSKLIPFDNNSPLYNECHSFIDACFSRKDTITCGNKSLETLFILDNAQKSLDENKMIYIKQYEPIVENIYIHPTAIIDDQVTIGMGTKVWHYSHISKNSYIGKNCVIGQNVYIGPQVIIGNNCKIQNNVSIYTGVILEDDVFMGPSCVTTNDINPRAKHPKNGIYKKTLIKKGASIGANAVIICDNIIGEYSMIGAGSVVTKNIDSYTVVIGNPARKYGTIDKQGKIKKL